MLTLDCEVFSAMGAITGVGEELELVDKLDARFGGGGGAPRFPFLSFLSSTRRTESLLFSSDWKSIAGGLTCFGTFTDADFCLADKDFGVE